MQCKWVPCWVLWLLLAPVHRGPCPLMASLWLPSCPVLPGPWFMSQGPSAPCLPPGCGRGVAVWAETLSWGQPPALAAKRRGGLCQHFLVHGCLFLVVASSSCSEHFVDTWSWAMAGSAPASWKGNRRAKEQGVCAVDAHLCNRTFLFS